MTDRHIYMQEYNRPPCNISVCVKKISDDRRPILFNTKQTVK